MPGATWASAASRSFPRRLSRPFFAVDLRHESGADDAGGERHEAYSDERDDAADDGASEVRHRVDVSVAHGRERRDNTRSS